MIKIALLLRGQPRFSHEGAEMFQKFVKQQYPDLEVKVFAHAWTTMSARMISTDAKNRSLEREVPIILKEEEVKNMLDPWEPEQSWIENESDNLKLATEIDLHNVNHVEGTYRWFIEHTKEYDLEDPLYQNRYLLLPRSLEVDDTFKFSDLLTHPNLVHQVDSEIKMDRLRLGYLLGQMHSAGKSFKLLQDYVEETGYHPDIVISTRYDIAMWFHSLTRLIQEIIRTDDSKRNTIFCRRIFAQHSVPVPDDYVFVGTFTSFGPFLSNIRNRLYETFTNDTIHLFDIFRTGTRLQHMLWTKIANPEIIFAQTTMPQWDAHILRPDCFDMNKFHKFDRKEFNELAKDLQQYEYPDVAKDITFDEIQDTWNTILNPSGLSKE